MQKIRVPDQHVAFAGVKIVGLDLVRRDEFLNP